MNIDNSYIEGIFTQIDPTELQLNKANSAETKAAFLDLHLSISNGLVSSKIYDIAMILILTLLPSRFWMVTFLVSPLMVFTFLSLFGVADFSACNKTLTAKLLKQGYRYHIL